MAEKEKKYFWLKLPRNFFDKHYIKALRRKKHEDFPEVFGNMLVLFYVWMLAESIDHSGCLRYSESKPYDAETLSDVSDFPLHFVTLALPIFTELELVVTESDGTLFLPKSAKMIGSESASAQRVREHRERKKAEHDNSETIEKPDKTADGYNVTQSNEVKPESNIENKSIENKSIDIITDSKESVCRTEVQRVVDTWNSLGDIGIKGVSKMSSTSKRYKSLVARIKEYGSDKVIEAIESIRDSDFLRGKNRNGWTITFDWFMLPNNFPKVLDGNYANPGGQKQRTGDAKLDRLYNRVSEVDDWV